MYQEPNYNITDTAAFFPARINLSGSALAKACLPVLIIALLATIEASAYSFQPPANFTGAPPSNNTCANCHTGVGSGSLELVLDGGLTTYEPGVTYPLEVLIDDIGQQRFGFSLVSRLASSPSVSTGTWTAGTSSGVYDMGNHIGHSNAPFAENAYTFNIMWTAPGEDVGDITFYGVANAANGNSSNGAGDNIYTQQLTIRPAVAAVTFWANSPVENGWRNTTEGYPGIAGIGWIYDDHWPWYFTYQHSDNPAGDWVYVFTDSGSPSEFTAYNYTSRSFFYALPSIGWYYSYKSGEEGWYPFDI